MKYRVEELIMKDANLSEILSAASESERYTEKPGEDRYQVFESQEYLVVGIPGEGVYFERTDGEEVLDEQGHGFYIGIDEDPWTEARETTYRIEGDWEEVIENSLEAFLDEKSFNNLEDSSASSYSWKQHFQRLLNLGDSGHDTFPVYISSEDGEAMVEFNENNIRLHEKGKLDIPSLEQLEGIEIENVTIGELPEDQKIKNTLEKN